MQGAAAEGRSRGSPSAMDKADESAKKARLEPPNVHVKQELGVHEAGARGGDGGAIVAAAEHSPRVGIAVNIDMCVLHCPLCTLPFKPPVFQVPPFPSFFRILSCRCAGLPTDSDLCAVQGRALCLRHLRRPAALRSVQDVRGRRRALRPLPRAGRRRVVDQDRVPQRRVPEVRDLPRGRRAPERVPARALQLHGAGLRIRRRGAPARRPPRSRPLGAGAHRPLRQGEPDPGPRVGRVFLLTVGALGASASAVSVVCARASAATRPRFTCKMWANLAASEASNGGKTDIVLVEMQMRSSTSSGAVVAAGEPTFLAVPPMYLIPGADGGDGAAMEVPLNVHIDKSSPWSDLGAELELMLP